MNNFFQLDWFLIPLPVESSTIAYFDPLKRMDVVWVGDASVSTTLTLTLAPSPTLKIAF
jgi:hypothetical protein